MSLSLEPTSTLDRIRRNLVGLKMARALELRHWSGLCGG